MRLLFGKVIWREFLQTLDYLLIDFTIKNGGYGKGKAGHYVAMYGAFARFEQQFIKLALQHMLLYCLPNWINNPVFADAVGRVIN